MWWGDQGQWEGDTLWEQLSSTVQWSPPRRFLICVPPALLLFAAHYSDYDVAHLLVTGLMTLVLVIAKLPEMHGVRLLGLNKGPDHED